MKLDKKEKAVALIIGGVWCFGLAALGVLGANYLGSSKGTPVKVAPTAEATATDTPMPTETPLPTDTPLPTATATRVVLPGALTPEATEAPLELPTLAATYTKTPEPAATAGKATPESAEPAPTLLPAVACEQQEQAVHDAKVTEINDYFEALTIQIQNELNQTDPVKEPEKYDQLAASLQLVKTERMQQISEENTRHLTTYMACYD